MVDLISGETYNGKVSLVPFEPVLLEFCEAELIVNGELYSAGETKVISVNVTGIGNEAGFIDITIDVESDGIKVKRADIKKYIGSDTTENINMIFQFLKRTFMRQ